MSPATERDTPAASLRPTAGAEQQPRFTALRRAGMAAATAFLGINLWTGAPLLALWIGSRVVGQHQLSMAAVGVVVITLAILVLAMVFALSWLDGAYKRLTGHPLRENRLTWLRSMNVERETVGEGIRTSMLERIVMVNVYVAVIALLAFWILVPVSPLPG